MSDIPEISPTQARLLYQLRLVDLSVVELETLSAEKTKKIGVCKRHLKKYRASVEDLLACKMNEQGELFNDDDMIQPSPESQQLLDNPTQGIV